MADANNIKVETIIEYEPGVTNVAQELELAKMTLFCRVFILFAKGEDAASIFREIEALNMTEAGFIWFVSEQALQAANVPNGIIAVRLVSSRDTNDARKQT